MGKSDLHTHTTASDGSCTPENLLKLAASKSLQTVAITDHDTIKGYLQAKSLAGGYSVNLIPGVEITALWEKREIHILGYCFNSEHAALSDLLMNHRRARILRMEQMITLLKKKGLDISLDEVRSIAGSGTVGRPHLAELLVKKRYVASISEAFIRYLGNSIISAIQTGYSDIGTVIQTLKSAGGASVLAHPGPLYSTEEVKKLLHYGIDGIECIHPSHSFDQQKFYTEWAAKENLLVTGGSDFHGSGMKYDPYFGIVTLGDSRVNDVLSMSFRRKKLQQNG